MYKKLLRAALILISISSIGIGGLQAAPPLSSSDPGRIAFEAAAESNQFLLVHLYSGKPDPELEKAYKEAGPALGKKLKSVSLDLETPGEKFLVKKYNLGLAPLPIVILIAPNGVISGSFKRPFSPEQVKSSFHTPGLLECFLAFQERKLMFISFQGKNTSENKEALKGIEAFKKENPLFRVNKTLIVDPEDKVEKRLISQLGIKPDIKKATTIMFAPPGRIVGRWNGATDSKEILKNLRALAKTCSTPSCADPNCK